MLGYIEQLRKRPEPQKRKAVLFWSLTITLGIAIIWGIWLFMRISGTDFSFKTNAAIPSLSQTFSGVIDQFNNIINSEKAAVATSADPQVGNQ